MQEMQTIRRITKRNLIGTRVSAPWNDGRYYCGVIESATDQPNGQQSYVVRFDDGYNKTFFGNEIVGPGFNSIDGVYLKIGQKVFVTLNDTEVYGSVIKHNRNTNDIMVEVQGRNNEVMEVIRKLDEVRLLESTKINSMQETTPIDVKKILNSENVEGDVSVTRNRRRKHDETTRDEYDVDMQMAAMALQNLSCSPASPKLPLDLSKSPQSFQELSLHRPSPSPPDSRYCSSAPLHGFFGSASTDEGIDVDDTMYPMDDIVLKRRKAERTTPRKMYACTWKGCGVIKDNCDSIEKHIRQTHLGPKDEDDISDHEEEFYYEEIEDMASNFVAMTCSSPVQSCPLNLSLPYKSAQSAHPPTGADHDYQRKEGTPQPASYTSPILIPGASVTATSQCLSPSSPYSPLSYKMSPASPSSSSASPKHHSSKKNRNDVKKCRKIYGMENKELWCTQCKWKKACTRFTNE